MTFQGLDVDAVAKNHENGLHKMDSGPKKKNIITIYNTRPCRVRWHRSRGCPGSSSPPTQQTWWSPLAGTPPSPTRMPWREPSPVQWRAHCEILYLIIQNDSPRVITSKEKHARTYGLNEEELDSISLILNWLIFALLFKVTVKDSKICQFRGDIQILGF